MVSLLFTYAILRLQHLLPLNPQGLGPLSGHLAFTPISRYVSRSGHVLRLPSRTSIKYNPIGLVIATSAAT
jgi:K+-transporting ATPase A subunit